MSGGGEGLGGGSRDKRGHSKRKKKKRIGFKLDMTPLVDITFLLLTFFMFTTTMLKPQIMNMKIPPEWTVDVQVIDKELFTLSLTADNKLYWFIGIPGKDNPVEEIQLKDLRAKAIEVNLKPMVKNKMITCFKISRDAKYNKMVEILDELNLAEVGIKDEISKDIDKTTGLPTERQRKFTIAVLSEDDSKKIEEFKK